MKNLIIICLLIFFFNGCVTNNIANFSIVSTKNYQLEKEYKSIGRISGEDIQYIIIFIPTGTIRIDDAVTNTLIQNNAEYLTDVSVFNEVFYIPYIGGYNKYIIKGEGWKSVQNTMNQLNIEEDVIIRYNPETGERIPSKK